MCLWPALVCAPQNMAGEEIRHTLNKNRRKFQENPEAPGGMRDGNIFDAIGMSIFSCCPYICTNFFIWSLLQNWLIFLISLHEFYLDCSLFIFDACKVRIMSRNRKDMRHRYTQITKLSFHRGMEQDSGSPWPCSLGGVIANSQTWVSNVVCTCEIWFKTAYNKKPKFWFAVPCVIPWLNDACYCTIWYHLGQFCSWSLILVSKFC